MIGNVTGERVLGFGKGTKVSLIVVGMAFKFNHCLCLSFIPFDGLENIFRPEKIVKILKI